MEEIMLKILQSREDRARKQEDLIENYKNTLISFTVNSPGAYKDSEMYRDIHRVGYREILSKLHEEDLEVLHREVRNKETGSEAYIVVDAYAKVVKHLMVDIEEDHDLGRIFDIDVFDKDARQIGRRDINKEKRKCILCDKDALVCMREKNHSYEDLIGKIKIDWKNYRENIM